MVDHKLSPLLPMNYSNGIFLSVFLIFLQEKGSKIKEEKTSKKKRVLTHQINPGHTNEIEDNTSHVSTLNIYFDFEQKSFSILLEF